MAWQRLRPASMPVGYRGRRGGPRSHPWPSCPHHFSGGLGEGAQANVVALDQRAQSKVIGIRMAGRIRRFFRQRFQFGSGAPNTSYGRRSITQSAPIKTSSAHCSKSTVKPGMNATYGIDRAIGALHPRRGYVRKPRVGARNEHLPWEAGKPYRHQPQRSCVRVPVLVSTRAAGTQPRWG